MVLAAAEQGEGVVGRGRAAVEHLLHQHPPGMALHQPGHQRGGHAGGAVLELRHRREVGEVGVVQEGQPAGIQQRQHLGDVRLEHRQIGMDQRIEGDHQIELLLRHRGSDSPSLAKNAASGRKAKRPRQ